MDPVNQKLLIAGGALLLLRLIIVLLKRHIPRMAYKTLGDYVDSGIAATVIAFLIATFLFQISRVEGISMRPTLRTGEYTLIDKVSFRLHAPRRGDVVVFRSPVDPGRDYIKRVIGVPGDLVEIKLGKVLINRKPINEAYIQEPPFYYFGPERVPEDAIFVLGDNRNNSLDSHCFHSVRMDSLRGRACVIIWPISNVGSIPSHR